MKARNWKGRFYVHILTFLYGYLELFALVNGSKTLPSIQWSFQNPRFQEGSIRLNVSSYSKVNIICPTKYVALKETDSDPTENQLYENVWMVDSSSYRSCNINTSIASNKKLLNCDQPSKLHWTKLLFLPLTPSGDAGYNPGETYYYISTSDGGKSSLDQTSGGHCKTNNMKLEVYICRDKEDKHCPEATSIPPTTSAAAFHLVTDTISSSTLSPVGSSTKAPASTAPPTTEPSTWLVNQNITDPPPNEPADVGAFKRDKPTSTGVSLLIVPLVVLGAVLAVSVGVNIYFFKKYKRKPKSNKLLTKEETVSV